MVLLDDRILEILSEHGPLSPTEICESLPPHDQFSRPYTNQRCIALAEHGLVEDMGNGIYCIEREGREYLAGEYEAVEEGEDGPT